MGRTLVFCTFIALLLLSGCGGSKESPTPDRPMGVLDPATAALWAAVPEPEIEVNPRWMRIEVRHDSGGGHLWLLNGGASPATREDLLAAASHYAKEVDEENGLHGLDATGQSQNPVLFAAPPEASSQRFMEAIEILVTGRICTVVVELATETPRRLRHELPRDESLGWQPDRRPVRIALGLYGERLEFRIHLQPERPELPDVDVVTQRLAEQDSFGRKWFGSAWKDTRRAVAEMLLARQGFGLEAGRTVRVTLERNADNVCWSALFLTFDAIELANRAPGRAPRPKLATELNYPEVMPGED